MTVDEVYVAGFFRKVMSMQATTKKE